MDLDGLFSEGTINKVNGKYRHALNGGSTGQTIPKENQWEWLDAYLLYKEYSTTMENYGKEQNIIVAMFYH